MMLHSRRSVCGVPICRWQRNLCLTNRHTYERCLHIVRRALASARLPSLRRRGSVMPPSTNHVRCEYVLRHAKPSHVMRHARRVRDDMEREGNVGSSGEQESAGRWWQVETSTQQACGSIQTCGKGWVSARHGRTVRKYVRVRQGANAVGGVVGKAGPVGGGQRGVVAAGRWGRRRGRHGTARQRSGTRPSGSVCNDASRSNGSSWGGVGNRWQARPRGNAGQRCKGGRVGNVCCGRSGS